MLGARRRCSAGEAVTVIVRPEVIQLGRAPGSAGSAIAWTGVVRQRFFRGTRNVYTMRGRRPHRLTVDAPPDQTAGARHHRQPERRRRPHLGGSRLTD